MKRSFLALFSMRLLAMVPASFAIQEQQPDFSQLERCIAEELKETNTPGATGLKIGQGVRRRIRPARTRHIEQCSMLEGIVLCS